MHAIIKLNGAIRSSRRRTQAEPSRNVEKSEPLIMEQAEKRKKPKAEHTNTKQQRYINSGYIRLTPR